MSYTEGPPTFRHLPLHVDLLNPLAQPVLHEKIRRRVSALDNCRNALIKSTQCRFDDRPAEASMWQSLAQKYIERYKFTQEELNAA